MSFKIGQGYDVHQLKDNIPLYIGGVNIKHTKGIVAHSDGDILIPVSYTHLTLPTICSV